MAMIFSRTVDLEKPSVKIGRSSTRSPLHSILSRCTSKIRKEGAKFESIFSCTILVTVR